MILGVAMLAGIVVAWALGARLSLLSELRFRGDVLVFGALAVQLVIFTSLASMVPEHMHRPVHVISYLMIIGFLLLNARVPGFWLVTGGIGLNVLVIFSNGGRMPVSLDAWRATGADPSLLVDDGGYNNNMLSGPGTHFPWLGDVFALPPSVPLANAISIGDVLIVIGVAAFIYRSCVPRLPRAREGVLAPLRIPEFRRVLAGRATSKMGDWLAMSAVVTWLYHETHSSTVIGIFLMARVLAAMVGAAGSAPLLDRVSGFKVLSAVEAMRGATTLLMIPLAASGHLVPVIVLSCVSTLLGSATNPSASGLLPDVLPASMLQAGNAMHGVARNVTAVTGTLLGGFAVSQFGIVTALWIDLITFVAAGLLYLRFAGSPSHADAVPGHEGDVSRRELLRALLCNRVVFGLTASFTVVTAAMGLLNSSLPAFFDLRFGQDEAYGYALGAIVAGLMCGELLTGFIRRESVARRSVGLAFLAMAGTVFVLADSSVAATAYLMLFLMGASDGTTEVVYDTLFQLNVRRRVLSGTYAMASAIQDGGQVAGFVLVIVYAHLLPGRNPLRLSALLCLIGVAIAGLALVGRRTAQDDADATIEHVAQSLPAATPAVPAALDSPLPDETLIAADGSALRLPQLAAEGPLVLALLGLEATDDVHGAALRELAGAGARVAVLTHGASPVAAELAQSGHARRFDDEPGRAFAAFGAVDGRCALAVADGEGITRLLFTENDETAWIPASVVRSRLRRLVAPDPQVQHSAPALPIGSPPAVESA